MNTKSVFLPRKNISQAREWFCKKQHSPDQQQKPDITKKTPEKEHVNMASQAECESRF